jgi:hypothetical protein
MIRSALILTIVLHCLLAGSVARAHGGDLVYVGSSGQYQVRAFATWSDGWLDYSIDLRNVATGARIPGAKVTVQVFEDGRKLADWIALESGTVYELVEQSPEEIHWNLVVTISGTLGTTSFTHQLDVEPEDWLWSTLVVATGFFGAIAAHLFTAKRRASD